MLDVPPDIGTEVVQCVATVAAHYQVAPTAIMARLAENKETAHRSGENPRALGIYGVPAGAVAELGDARMTPERLASDDCLNVSIGVYRDVRDGRLPRLGAAGSASQVASQRTAPRRLPKLDERGEACVDAAAAAYRLPQPVFRAVLLTEGGWVGLRSKNSNGTYDLGPGQINTIHLPELAKAGITEHMLVHDVCVNVHVAAYRLRTEIERAKDFWRGVGNYHSRTPHLHKAYLQRVIKNL